MKISDYPRLKEDILKELDAMVCTKHPPDYDEETVAQNIIAIMEGYLS